MSNKKLPKVNMHGLIILREEGQGLLYMDIELQQHKLHMQALQCYILWSSVVLTEPLAIFFLKTKAEKLDKGKQRKSIRFISGYKRLLSFKSYYKGHSVHYIQHMI